MVVTVTLHDAVDGSNVLAVGLTGHGRGAWCSRMETTDGPIAAVRWIRVIDKRLFRVGSVCFVDCTGNFSLKVIRL